MAGWRERVAVIVTCEHASRAVPAALRPRLRLSAARLQSHSGFDVGASSLARTLAARLGAPLVLGRVTRLVVDLNRSPHNPSVFSRVTRRLARRQRDALLASWHAPHWQVVSTLVDEALDRVPMVVHLAAHSFTPVLAGKRRDFDVGLLYDPRRPREATIVEEWRTGLASRAPGLRVRLNAPYRGASDGLTTALRRRMRPGRYVGIEVEANQALLAAPVRWREARRALADAVAVVVARHGAATPPEY